MPKSQFINPAILLQRDKIVFKNIPVNAYIRTAKDERKRLGCGRLMNIYRTMAIIREFETALADIKEKGSYQGLTHTYNGPVHLCIGEEAAAVGQAYALGKSDFIFGSHRSHGELIAKGFCFIEETDDDELIRIMESEPAVCGGLTEQSFDSVKELAEDFLLYGAFSEIFAKATGFQKGFGGSMHVFFAPFGVYPNNAIVGASAPIATGAALFKKINRENSIAIANIGDGALGCGVVYEAMNFAAMDQYRELWEDKGGLPVLFNIIDNGYGMGGQTDGETMAFGSPARVGAGISPTQLHAERINGNNPLAVYDATLRQRERLLKGEGPALLDVVTYRIKGHSQSDKMQYREKEEIDAWRKHDPLLLYRKDLIESGIADENFFRTTHDEVTEKIQKLCKLALEAPYWPCEQVKDYLKSVTYSNSNIEKRKEDDLPPKENNSRYREILAKKRFGLDANGKKIVDGSAYSVNDAIFEAVFTKFYEDKTMISYGEDVRDWGGVCSVYKGLTETLPYRKLFNAPISEAAIVSGAVGYAMCGGRAVIEIMFADFMARAGDEIFNQLAKWQAMSAGKLKMPVVLRVSVGTKYGTQHSQDWTAPVSHIPGLKVVYPATPYDCKGLMNTALLGSDPVVFFESQNLYVEAEYFHKEGVPEDYYEIPIGVPDIKRKGTDITIITIGPALYAAIDAAEELKRIGIDAEILDARSISPFGYEKAAESITKTGRIAIVSYACKSGSVAESIASGLTERCFHCLKGAPLVIAAPDTVVPPIEYEQEYFPTASHIVSEITKTFFTAK
ncbi:MAG: thiamine pyrophosphate-dependent enzyme [Clostridia bacterium]|nr:thiamine pyrophosphate-dependent enzyme [Clostridia bacterium]